MSRLRRVALALSGGVDSAVAGLMLKEKGFSVCGVYVRSWDELDEGAGCQGRQDLEHARLVASKLRIPFYQVDFISQYWNHVFVDFISDYQQGLTPNPDMLCNKFIKFDALLSYVTKNLGVDALATGHYARNSFGSFLENSNPDVKPKLLKSRDERKDQTFFLSQIPNESLRKTMFPLADYTKYHVKEMARQNNLKVIADKKESRGICFIGPRRFQEFIAEYANSNKGSFIDIDNGEEVGTHDGIHQWTLGQKCRIGGLRHAYYVAKKTLDGTIFVASNHDHPSLYSSLLITEKPHWIHSEPSELQDSLSCEMRFQHGNPLTGCQVENDSDGCLKVSLHEPLRALTPGQYVVFYKKEECLGSARIKYTLDSQDIAQPQRMSLR